MSATLDASGAVAVELAEASLSARPDLVLVDRRTIDSVLQEQKLQAGGLVSADDAVRFGQLLSVDLFVHVEPVQGQQSVVVVAYETAQGIRLLDEVAGGKDAEALANGIAAVVERSLAKWQAPAGQTMAIALAGVRNVDLPKGRRGECDFLGALLERRLLGSPDVVVVERKRLEGLNRDREVAPNRPEEKLLSAPVLLELDVSQAGTAGKLQITAFLTNPHGGEIGRVAATEQTLPALADQLCSGILAALKKKSAPPPADPALEAARFFWIARFWTAQGRSDSALAAAEAAFALKPTSPLMEALLANALFAMANVTRVEARPDSLAYAARGAALLHRELSVPTFSDPERAQQLGELTALNNAFFRGYGESIANDRIEKPFSREEAETYAEYSRSWLAQSPFSPEADIAPSGWDLLLFVNSYFHNFPDQAAAWRVLAEQVKRWGKAQKDKDPPLIPGAMLSSLVNGGNSERYPLPAEVYRIRSDLWEYFKNQEDPLLRLYGRCGYIIDSARLSEAGKGDADAASHDFLNELYTNLLVQTDSRGIFREQIYQVAQLAIHRHSLQAGAGMTLRHGIMQQQLLEMIDLFRVMIKAGDVRGGVNGTIQVLWFNFSSLEPHAADQKSLVELEAIMTEAEANPPPALESWEYEELRKFHDWVRERRMPESTGSPSVACPQLIPVEMIRMMGRFDGITSLLADQEGVYVLSAYKDPCRLFLQKFLSGTSDVTPLGVVDLHGPHCMDRTMAGVADACLGENAVVVAVKDEGVFLFDRRSAAVEALQDTTSLPVTHPLSVGILDQKLYVGTDDGYLMAIDMHTQEGEILIAAVRKGKKSPFDDGPPVHISAIFPDPVRGRIVFVASVMEARGDLGNGAVSDLCGIWEYRPGTVEFRQLFEWSHRSGHLKWCEMVQDNAFVLSDIWGLVLWFDLESDKLDLLSHGENWPHVYAQQLLRRAGLYDLPPGILPVFQRQAAISPPFMARGDWLLTTEPWGRLSMKTYQWEALPPFRMPDGAVGGICPAVGMVPIGDHQILLAEWSRLWLMTEENEAQRFQ